MVDQQHAFTSSLRQHLLAMIEEEQRRQQTSLAGLPSAFGISEESHRRRTHQSIDAFDMSDCKTSVPELFAKPTAEESAALSWLSENLSHDSTKKILQQMRAWVSKMDRPSRRELAKMQDIKINRDAHNKQTKFMEVVRQHFLEKYLDAKCGQTAFAEFRRATSS